MCRLMTMSHCLILSCSRCILFLPSQLVVIANPNGARDAHFSWLGSRLLCHLSLTTLFQLMHLYKGKSSRNQCEQCSSKKCKNIYFHLLIHHVISLHKSSFENMLLNQQLHLFLINDLIIRPSSVLMICFCLSNCAIIFSPILTSFFGFWGVMHQCAPEVSLEERCRINHVATSIVALAQVQLNSHNQ